MTDAIFVTGANGLLGAAAINTMAKKLDPITQIIAIVRSDRAASELDGLLGTKRPRVQIVLADLLQQQSLQSLAGGYQFNDAALLHCAADVSWDKSFDELFPINVQGTLNAARFLEQSSRSGKFIYVSSAYTKSSDWDYRNGYEETKAVAEKRVRSEFPNLRFSQFSCSLVVGNSSDGEISRFHGLYPLVRLIAFYNLPFVVGRHSCKIDLVPIDWVSDELFLTIERALCGETPEVVATAGPNAVRLDSMVSEIQGEINAFRQKANLTPQPSLDIISNRRWEFLWRSIQNWKPEGLNQKEVRQISQLFQIYKPYTESDELRPASGVSSAAPRSQELLPVCVRFWLQQNSRRMVRRWKTQTSATLNNS